MFFLFFFILLFKFFVMIFNMLFHWAISWSDYHFRTTVENSYLIHIIDGTYFVKKKKE